MPTTEVISCSKSNARVVSEVAFSTLPRSAPHRGTALPNASASKKVEYLCPGRVFLPGAAKESGPKLGQLDDLALPSASRCCWKAVSALRFKVKAVRFFVRLCVEATGFLRSQVRTRATST